MRSAVFILKRVLLALVTLWILSVIVFLAGQKLPGDPGRAILGPLAQESGVRELDHKLGVDRPLVTQYRDWVTNLLHGDLGTSYEYSQPIAPMIRSALAALAEAGAGGVPDVRAAVDPVGSGGGAQLRQVARPHDQRGSGCRRWGCRSSCPGCS